MKTIASKCLSHLLLETWSTYENQVRRSRGEISTKNIHQLRVSTQKLEAVLTLANSLKSNHNSKNIIYLIKHVRKSLGPLRDSQVETTVLKELREKKLEKSDHKGFASFFAEKNDLAKKRAVKCLDKISLKQERPRIEKLAKRIVKVESQRTKAQIEMELNGKVKSSMAKLNRMMADMNPKQVNDIHRFRIQAKKLRYQGEFLSVLSGEMIFDLDTLKQAQSVAGRIQNDALSIYTLDQFLSKKKHSGDLQVLAVRKRIKKNQTNLIDKDFDKLSALSWNTLS